MESNSSRINFWSIPYTICRVNYILTERRRRSYREYLTSNRNKVQTEGIDPYIALRRQATSAGETPILRISELPEIFVNLPFCTNQQRDDFVFNSLLSILGIMRNILCKTLFVKLLK